VSVIRILFLADTHLGIDLPVRPRIERRRRGHDFLANFEAALHAAETHRVHLVIHGGDLFYRSRVPASVVYAGFAPLKRTADLGIPVYVVPGNHERSSIPFPMLAVHPGIHIFDRPRTFTVEVDGIRIALAGFPHYRRAVRDQFVALVDETRWDEANTDVNLLCVHQCFEGATVGPKNYTFRYAKEVVRAAEVPSPFAAVLAGHVHRHQVLTTDLRGQPLATPVLYPGSIERTSFAERQEEKGYLLLEVERGQDCGGVLRRWEFRRLSARPMEVKEVQADGATANILERRLASAIDKVPRDAVLRIRVHGQVTQDARAVVHAANLRALAPPTMNVEVMLVDDGARRSVKRT
jgi:DNA repair exonuclease SbcCD nuclease subunit